MILRGEVEEIVFRNSDNGYTVLELNSGSELVTCVGNFPIINTGESVEFVGDFKMNNKYGKQFSVTDARILGPKGVEGIQKYLSGGLIKGVGPVTAQAIVEHFGEDTLNIIEFAPRRLAEVRGVSAGKAAQIGAAFADIKKMQSTIMFLQKFEITINMAIKIFDIYGDKTETVVRKNPYALVESVDGIGFLTADKLAVKMGISPDSEFRLRAGVLHILKESAEKNGNTYLPRRFLEEGLHELLEVDFGKRLQSVLDELEIEGIIKPLVNDENGRCIAMGIYFNSEKQIAEKLCMLNFSDVGKVTIDADAEITTFETLQKITFHQTQRDAIKMAVHSGVSIITGGPGTGKTTIIKCILSLFLDMKERVLMLAPTGRAAKRIAESTGQNAKTIHRGLEYGPMGEGGENGRGGRFGFRYNEQNKLPYDVVIVDEVSMVDTMLFLSLLRALNFKTRLILVGDKNQLASVGAGNVLADMLSSGVICASNLTQIYRQSEDSYIISNAHAINSGDMPVLDNSSSDFFFEQREEPAQIADTIIDLVVRRIPSFLNKNEKTERAASIQVLAPMKVGACGIDTLNSRLQSELNPPGFKKPEVRFPTVSYRLGDRVMQTQNNYEIEWKRPGSFGQEESGTGIFNGDIGTISSITPQTGEVVISFEDGRTAVYTRDLLSQITLSYAITVHKSQGCEFDVVIMPVIAGAYIILTRNLLYTAVTRAKKIVVLVGSKANISRMVRNNYTAKRYSSLKELLIKKQEEFKNLYE